MRSKAAERKLSSAFANCFTASILSMPVARSAELSRGGPLLRGVSHTLCSLRPRLPASDCFRGVRKPLGQGAGYALRQRLHPLSEEATKGVSGQENPCLDGCGVSKGPRSEEILP
jgi:hypothetical protein